MLKRDKGREYETAYDNRFIVYLDESIGIEEYNVAKFAYNADNTFTISVRDYVFTNTDDEVKYSVESYFAEKKKYKKLYTIKVDLLYESGDTIYTEKFTGCQIIKIQPDDLDYGNDKQRTINVTFTYGTKKIDF